MNQSCTSLATKAELEALRDYINSKLDEKLNKSQEVSIIQAGGALGLGLASSKILTVEQLAQRGLSSASQAKTIANTAVNSANIARSSSVAAIQQAKKAGFDALYAQSKAASAASRAASAAGNATKALGLIGSIFGIIGTLATATQLAILSKEVAGLKKRQTEFENSTKKELSLLRVRANSARDIANTNVEEIDDLKSRLNQTNADISAVKGDVTKTNTKIEQFNQEIATLRSKFDSVNENIASTNKRVDETNQRINQASQTDLTNINNTVDRLQNDNLQRQRQIDDLTKQLVQFKADNNNLKQQLKKLDLITREELKKETQKQINRIVDNKIQQIESNSNNNQVNQEQYNQLNNKLDNLNNKVPNIINPYTVSIAVGSLPILQQILNKRNPISPCQAPTLVPPVAAQARANNAAILGFQSASLAQNAAIQRTVNLTQNIVSHGKHGLQAMQNAADVAWKATHADKALQMLNTVLLIHNALYLGRNIGETIGDASSMVLTSLGIKDSEGNPIDINQVIGSGIKNWIVERIGAINYAAMEQKFNSSNRFYQGITNLWSGVRSMLASAEDIAEETGVNVAQIGNALRDSGTVESDSYGHMPEGNRRFNKLFTGLEKADDTADSFYRITSDIQDLTEEAQQFNSDRKEFKDSLNAERDEVKHIDEKNQNRIESLAEPTEADKLETEDN